MAGAGNPDILQYFKKGAEVEISINDPDFRNSFFEGTVLQPADSEFSKAKVQYKTLLNNAGKRPLKEWVRLVDIRPSQPRENRAAYELSDAVDAYHNEGWWEGYITDKDEEGRYKVYFRGTKDEVFFPPSELRPHHEWDKGRWIPPLDPAVPVVVVPESIEPESKRLRLSSAEDNIEGIEGTSKSGEHVEAIEEASEHILKPGERVEAIEEAPEYIYKPGDIVEASSEEQGLEGAWFTATVIEETTAGKYTIEYHTLKTDDETGFLREEVDVPHLRPNPPDVGLVDSFVIGEEVDAWYNDCWWEGVIKKVLKNSRYTVYFENSKEELKFEHGDLRVRQEWRNGKWRVASKALGK